MENEKNTSFDSTIIRDIFGITVDRPTFFCRTHFSQKNKTEKTCEDADCLEKILHDKIMNSHTKYKIWSFLKSNKSRIYHKPMAYFFQCYKKVMLLIQNPVQNNMAIKLEQVITELLIEVAISKTICKNETLLDIFLKNYLSDLVDFKCFVEYINRRVLECKGESLYRETITSIVLPSFTKCKNILSKSTFEKQDFEHIVQFLTCVCNSDIPALVFLDSKSIPSDSLKFLRNTLLWTLFSISPIPNYNIRSISAIYGLDKPDLNLKVSEEILSKLQARLDIVINCLYEFIKHIISISNHIKKQLFKVFKNYLILNKYRIFEWTYMNVNSKTRFNDGFMINFSTILMMLSKSLNTVNNQFVDARHFEVLAAQIDDQNKLNVRNYFVHIDKDSEDQNDLPNDKTTLFYMAHRCLNLTLKSVYNEFKSYNSKHKRWFNTRNFTKNRIVYASHLFRRQFIEDFFSLNKMTAIYLSLLSKVQFSSLTMIPEFFINNISDFVIFLPCKIEDVQKNWEIYFSFSTDLIAYSHIIRNPHLRGYLAETIFSLLKLNGNVEQLSVSFERNKYICTFVRLFTEISNIETDNMGSLNATLLRSRTAILRGLMRFLCIVPFQEDLKLTKNIFICNGIPLLLKFIHVVVDDFSKIVHRCSKLENFKKKELVKQIAQSTNTYSLLGTHIDFCMMLQQIIGNYLLGRSILDTLNSTLVLALRHHYFLLIKVDNVKELHIGRQSVKLFKIISNFEKNDRSRNYLEHLVQCRYFRMRIIKKFLDKVSQENEALQVEVLYNKIKNAYDKLNETFESFDIPCEFLDALLNTVMDDPVILPKTQIRVDRSTIFKHLLSSPTNPFTREPLTMKMLVSDNSLKDSIKEWKLKNNFD